MNKKFAIKACCCIPKRVRVRPNQGGSRKRAGRSQQGVELQKQRKDSEALEITQLD
jgi:hypothetical protein